MPGCCATSKKKFYLYASIIGGQGRLASVTTRYRLDGPGNESWWKRDFAYLPRPVLRPTKTLVQTVTFIFPRGGVTWAWR